MKLWIIVGVLFALVFFLACAEENIPENRMGSGSVYSPNEDSELALLMRFMYDDMERVKNELEAGRNAELKFDPEQMFTAEPTDSVQVSSDEYKAFGQTFIAAYNAFQQAGRENIKEHYGVLVQNCMVCHQSTCPGPMRRIENLYFDR